MSIYSALQQTSSPPRQAGNRMGDMNDGSGTINPADLNSHPVLPQPTVEPSPRGIKRSRSPDTYREFIQGGDDDADESKPRKKRERSSRTPRTSGDIPGATDSLPTPSSQTSPAQVQTPQLKSQALPAQPQVTPVQGSPQTKATPKSTIKALPSVRDHTSNDLGETGDEYIPREFDEEGDKKVDLLGYPQGGRQYKMRTFTLPGRGEKMFMLATECARVLAYRDSYLLFNKNRSLYKIIASQEEKDNLIQQDILPYAYRSRQIAIVTARSMFRQFGSRVIQNGRRVRDDYWEAKARKQGFTEEDAAGEKRPGATRAKEQAIEAQQGARQTMFAPSDIVYSTGPGFGAMQPPPMHAGIASTMAPLPVITSQDSRYRDINRPKQDVTGPAYVDSTRATSENDIMGQAIHGSEYSKALNHGSSYRKTIVADYWGRPHDPPISTPPPQPAETVAVTAGQGYQSPRYSTSDFNASQTNMLHQSQQQGMNPPNYPHQQNPMHSPLGAGRQPTIQPNLLRDPPQYTPQPQQQIPAQLHRNASNVSIPQSPSQGNPYAGYHPVQPHMWGGPPPQPHQQSPALQRMSTPQGYHMGQSGMQQHPGQSPHPSPSPHQQQQLYAGYQNMQQMMNARGYPQAMGQGQIGQQQYGAGQGFPGGGNPGGGQQSYGGYP